METLYPEIAAGGFARNDHHFIFYSRVQALLGPDMSVLEFGAGRGRFADHFSGPGLTYKRKLTTLRGNCRLVVGCDIDPAVHQNPLVDEAVVIQVDKPLPFPDSSFDMIVSWAVFEHIENPKHWAREFERILRPGGWVCAWTPNKWGYIAMCARLVPNRWHKRVLQGLLKMRREEEDIFPTRYRMNTRGALRRLFPRTEFEHYTYGFTGPPAYVTNFRIASAAVLAYSTSCGQRTAALWHIFLRKKLTPDR